MNSPSTLKPSEQKSLETFEVTTHSIVNSTIKSKPPIISCPICLDEHSPDKMITVSGCHHSFCSECIREYLTARINTSKVLMVPCPQSGCKQILSKKTIKKSLDQENYKRFHNIARRKITLRTTRHKFCPKPGCSRRLKLSTRKEYSVCGCGTQICNTCTSFRHEGRSCLDAIDPEFELYSKDNKVRFCIVCKTPGNKESGCSYIKCPVCEFEWCWTCGRQYIAPHVCCCYWSPVSPREWKNSSFGGKLWFTITEILRFPFKLLGCLLLWPFFDCFESDFSSLIRRPLKSFCLVLFSIFLGILLLPFSLPLVLCCGTCVKVASWAENTENRAPKPWMTGNADKFNYSRSTAPIQTSTSQPPVNEGRQIVESQEHEKKEAINIEPKIEGKTTHVAIEIAEVRKSPSNIETSNPKIKEILTSDYVFLPSKRKDNGEH